MDDTILSQFNGVAADFTAGTIGYTEAMRRHGEIRREVMRVGTNAGNGTYIQRCRKSDETQKVIELRVATTPGVITAGEYWDLCSRHDWYHGWSDDYSVDRAGAANYQWLSNVAEINSGFAGILHAWSLHKFSGQHWGTEQAPKPERPQ